MIPASPHHAAGPRIEPPVSDPIAARTNPAAIAAPEPDDDQGLAGILEQQLVEARLVGGARAHLAVEQHELAPDAHHHRDRVLGDGAGGFAQAVSVASAAVSPTRIALADFNRDGRLDVAITNRAEGGYVAVLPNEPGERCAVAP